MSVTLNFKVCHQNITRADSCNLVADSLNYAYAHFDFCSSDWDGLIKTAVFTRGQDTYEQILEDDQCLIPWEVLPEGKGIFTVSVFAGNRITTNTVKAKLDASGWSFALESSQPPTEGVYSQILTRLADVEDTVVESAESAAQSATSAAESAQSAEQSMEAARTAKNAAEEAAGSVTQYSKTSESWAVGGTGTRTGEDTDNSKYYAEQAGAASQTAVSASNTATGAAQAATQAAGSASQSARTAAEGAQVVQELYDGAVSDITAAKTAAVGAIQTKGDQVIDSIPEDYTELSGDVSQLKADLSDKDALTVGTAKQLVGDKFTEDKVPYLFRQSGGGLTVGNREYMDAIVGGTVAWNQLVKNGNFANGTAEWGTNRVSLSVENKVCKLQISNADTSSSIYQICDKAPIATHKYLYSITITSSKTTKLRFAYGLDGLIGGASIQANAKTTLQGVFNISDREHTNLLYIYPNRESDLVDGDIVEIEDVMLCDLTAKLNSEIADHIYALEQANSGDGVAFFKKLFPEDYYAYNPGELISVSGVSAHETRDANNNVIGNYPLDSTLILRGVPKLVNGKIQYDGDRYLPDGTVKRRYGVVDLGTLDLEYSETDNYFLAPLPANIKKYATRTQSLMCKNYIAITDGRSYANCPDKCVYNLNVSPYKIGIKDSAYTDAATFKAAMSGVMLVYELATPTTETAAPYRSDQLLDAGGTEEFVSTGIVPVGHETRYAEDLVKKLESLPWDMSMIAPIETGTTASRAYAVGRYFILNDQFCKAKTAIAPGATFTLNTNYEVTTVANELYTALH